MVKAGENGGSKRKRISGAARPNGNNAGVTELALNARPQAGSLRYNDGVAVMSGLAPRSDWTAMPGSEHFVQFYESSDFLLNSLSDFITTGLSNGDCCLVVATKTHRDTLEEQLGSSGLDLQSARVGGQYLSLDAAETLSQFMIDGWPDKARFAEVVGGLVRELSATRKQVRVYGEMVSVLCAEGRYDAATALEALWNGLQRAHSFSLFCAYPINQFAGDGLASHLSDVCREHGTVIPAESYTTLIGENDRLRQIAFLQQKATLLEMEIAERKKAEAQLRRKEEELRDFVENATVAMHWVDAEGIILWANQAELEMLGCTREEYIGHHITEFHADATVIEDILQRLTSRETLHNYEARLRCKDGSVRHALISSNVLWEDGKFVHTRCFTRDVTERKQAQTRIAADLEAMTRLLDVGNHCAQPGEDYDKCLAELLEAAIAVTGANKGTLQLLDAATSTLTISAQRGFEEPFLKVFARVQGKESSACGVAMQSAERIIVEDVGQSEIFAGQPSLDVLLAAGVRAVQSTPLISSAGNLLGMISTHFSMPHRAFDRELRLMDLLARQAADYLERKQAEQALTEQARLLDLSHDAIVVRDFEGRILYWNRGAEMLYGWPREKSLGKVIHALLKTEFPKPLEQITEELYRDNHWNGEFLQTTRDGRRISVLVRKALDRDSQGNPKAVLETLTDITERKRTEALLATQKEAFEMAASGAPLTQVLEFLAREVEGHSQQGAMMAIHLLDDGAKRFEQLGAPSLPTSYAQAVNGMEVSSATGPCCAAIARGRRVVVADISASGEFPAFAAFVLPLGIRAGWSTPIFSSTGKVLGTFASYYRETREPTPQDNLLGDVVTRTASVIIERKQAEQKLQKLYLIEQTLRGEAERANRMKDEFLATVSHELRTPLNAIIGWSNLLHSGKLDEPGKARALDTIDRNAKAQAQLIEDILDVSRVITGKLRLDKEPVDMASIIAAAIDSVQVAAETKDIQIKVTVDTLAPSVSGDSNRLQQVVWNLLANAVKFTPAGGKIEVRLERKLSNIQIVIKDTGEGIASDFLPFIFDRFRQADGTLTRRHNGLGLGLAIVRHLVELHGGEVFCESPGEGLGSTFIVSLPLESARKLHKERKRRRKITSSLKPSKAQVNGSPRLDGVQVLLVDDDSDTLQILKAVLSRFGANVELAESVAQAWEILSQFKPDIVVSDLAMPDEDGYSLIQKIRAAETGNGQRMAALALTACVRIEDRTRALSAGFNMFVPKPVEPDELISAIGNLVDKRPAEV